MKRRSRNKSAYDILQLQNVLKKDPESYYDEFLQQYEHYHSVLKLFKLKPQEYDETLADLVSFLAQVSTYYKELEDFPNVLISILREYSTRLDPAMRLCFCKALILMRNRGIVPPADVIKLFFYLLRCNDKILRKHLQVHIISDIKNMNAKHKNAKLNTVVQNYMYEILSDSNATASKMSLDIMIELYRRHVWRDAKTVNAIATACFSKVNKILVAAHQFFLGVDEEEDESSSDSEGDTPTVKEVMSANKVNKKSRKRMKILKRTKQVLKKSKKKKNKEVFDFSAIHLLHDPQGMAEKLLKKLESMKERFEFKMLVMNLISRLVGVHELILLNFYPLLIRYIKPHQKDVTKILMFAAQAAHPHVPPDVMDPIIKTIAHNFISERNSDEVMTVGLNAAREICVRCPLAMEQYLLQDLVQYCKYKNKNVAMAAKSLAQLYRKINPEMLQRKYRARPTEASREAKAPEYGALNAKSYIPGAEVLPLEPSKEDDQIKEEEDDDSDGSWIDVSHSEDEVQSSDDDEDSNTVNENIDAEENFSAPENKKKHEEITKESQNSDNSTHPNPADSKEKAALVSQSRILSQEEFRKLKVAELVKQVQYAKGKKRKAGALDEPEIKSNEIVSLKEIEKLHKRPKPTKETRLQTVMEGREGREKYSKKKRKNPFSGKTQKEKNKNKAFMMIKHKVRAKVKRSFKDKQIALRDALLKRKRKR